MAGLSITTAWDETAEILKRDFGAFFSVALALVALPNFALQALGAGPLARAGTAGAGLLLPLLLIVLFCILAGNVALSTLALGRERVVKAAIVHGFRRAPSMLGAALILLLAASILFVPVVALSGVTPEQLKAPQPETLKRLGLLLVLLALIFVAIGVRLQLMIPSAAAERLGPVGILKRSWGLTSGHFWKLLGFNLLVLLTYAVVMLASGAVFGLLIMAVAGRPDPGSLSWLLVQLVNAIIAAAFSVVITTMLARVYVQLAGGVAPAGAGEPTAGS